MSKKITSQSILEGIKGFDLGPIDKEYFTYHKKRYTFILNRVSEISNAKAITDRFSVLDVGPHFQTALLRYFFPDATVNTLGAQYKVNSLRDHEKHAEMDLNDVDRGVQLSLPQHDLVLFCEVIEHLYTPPDLVLTFLSQFVKQGGYMMIQTPNAVALHKRLRMAVGLNPYMLLRKTRRGHFREYTRKELKQIISQAGLDIVELSLHNYFNPNKNFAQRMYYALEKFMPPAWRDGITIICKKEMR